jgi:type IV pilus assembly protein PilX
VASWPAGCGQGAFDRGLCGARDPPAWQTLDLAAAGNPALVRYGDFTGAPMAVGAGLLPARLPAYLLESLAGGAVRITAVGFGARASTLVVLQALYRKQEPGAPPGRAHAALPAGRIGWREIVNWPELHARSGP